MLINDQMPDLSRYAKPEQRIDALYQYVYNLRHQINHVLSNLDGENLGADLKSTIAEIQKAVSEAVQTGGKQEQTQDQQQGQTGITEEKDPTVPEWAKQKEPPAPPVTSVNGQVGDVVLDLGGKPELYRVGDIYITTSTVSPASLFGGTWEQIKDRFLLAAGSTYTAGKTGGAATHKLTESEMPSHYHTIYQQNSSGDNTIGLWDTYVKSSYQVLDQKYDSSQNIKAYAYGTGSKGGNAAHNNMPPYLAVYVWKRVS